MGIPQGRLKEVNSREAYRWEQATHTEWEWVEIHPRTAPEAELRAWRKIPPTDTSKDEEASLLHLVSRHTQEIPLRQWSPRLTGFRFEKSHSFCNKAS